MIYRPIRTPLEPLHLRYGAFDFGTIERWAISSHTVASEFVAHHQKQPERSTSGSLHIVKTKVDAPAKRAYEQHEVTNSTPQQRYNYTFVALDFGTRNKRLVVGRCDGGHCGGALAKFDWYRWCTLDGTRRMCRACTNAERKQQAA